MFYTEKIKLLVHFFFKFRCKFELKVFLTYIKQMYITSYKKIPVSTFSLELYDLLANFFIWLMVRYIIRTLCKTQTYLFEYYAF